VPSRLLLILEKITHSLDLSLAIMGDVNEKRDSILSFLTSVCGKPLDKALIFPSKRSNL
jgi:hypothetical protein